MKNRIKAYEGAPAPSPIEVMVFLVLGWLFVLAGEYSAMRLRQGQADPHLTVRGKSIRDTVPQFDG